MKATFLTTIKVVGFALFAILLAHSTVKTVQAQCCGGPGYYPEPYSPPVYFYRSCSPPIWHYRGCEEPMYRRPYVDPRAWPQPAPYGRGIAPNNDRSFAPDQYQPGPVPGVRPGLPTPPPQADRDASNPYEPVGPSAIVPSGLPAIESVPPRLPAPVDLQTLVERQKVCPVTGAELGSMGEPVRVRVKGRDVLLCCQGCVDRFKSDPDKYLARLNP